MSVYPISRRTFFGMTGAIAAFESLRVLGQEPPFTRTGLDFPIVDFHVHVEGSTTVEHVLQLARQRGVKIGIAEHGGVGEGMKTD
ncbi:MAG TPA: hypothetical protein VEO19_15005 [Terriglobia bacterium]|nr:hypothetical protein [Terriglobia bacterium]